jgi:hypothetical protein
MRERRVAGQPGGLATSNCCWLSLMVTGTSAASAILRFASLFKVSRLRSVRTILPWNKQSRSRSVLAALTAPR